VIYRQFTVMSRTSVGCRTQFSGHHRSRFQSWSSTWNTPLFSIWMHHLCWVSLNTLSIVYLNTLLTPHTKFGSITWTGSFKSFHTTSKPKASSAASVDTSSSGYWGTPTMAVPTLGSTRSVTPRGSTYRAVSEQSTESSARLLRWSPIAIYSMILLQRVLLGHRTGVPVVLVTPSCQNSRPNRSWIRWRGRWDRTCTILHLCSRPLTTSLSMDYPPPLWGLSPLVLSIDVQRSNHSITILLL